MRRLPIALALLVAAAAEASAWPDEVMLAVSRDARRLLPRSLARLLGEREREVMMELRRFPPQLAQAMAADAAAGRLRPETLAALQLEVGHVVELLRARRVSEGLARLGGLLRIPADLSDPVLSAGAEGYAPGVVVEYYAFVGANLDKIPVVLDDPRSLELTLRGLPEHWQRLLERSRPDAPLIGREMLRGGRVVSHRALDFRSPVYGVASLSYSRAVTATAATWLAVWREARGDTSRIRPARELSPREDAHAPAAPRASPPEGQ